MRVRPVCFIAALIASAWPGPAAAQGARPSDERIRELEQQLQKQQRVLEEQSRAIEELRRSLEKAPAAAAPAPIPAEGPTPDDSRIEATFQNGFRLKTADGNFDAHVGGRIVQHGRFVFNRLDAPAAAGGPPPNSFFFKEVYLQLDGTLYKDFKYVIQANFFPNNTPAGPFSSLSDAWVSWRPAPEFGITFGQMEVPISQEEICSTRYIDFVERSVLNRLVPTRDLGVEVYGALFDGVLEYEAGVFNGRLNANTSRNLNDNNDEKDVAGRLRVTPFKAGGADWIRQLRLGLAATTGNQGGPPDAVADLTSLETGTRFIDFDAATLNDGRRTRLGAEVSWPIGPFGLQAEYVQVRLDAANGAATGAITEAGYYVAATMLLTGEDKPREGRIVPAHPFSPGEGGWGAFELAARVAGVRVNGVFDGPFGAAGTGANDAITAYTFGINWYLTSNLRTSLDYIHNQFANAPIVNGHAIGSEDALLTRFQVDF